MNILTMETAHVFMAAERFLLLNLVYKIFLILPNYSVMIESTSKIFVLLLSIWLLLLLFVDMNFDIGFVW